MGHHHRHRALPSVWHRMGEGSMTNTQGIVCVCMIIGATLIGGWLGQLIYYTLWPN